MIRPTTETELGFVHFASGWSLSRSRAPGGQSELRWSFVDVMFSADIQKLRRKLVHQIGIDRAQPPQFTPYGQSLAKSKDLVPAKSEDYT